MSRFCLNPACRAPILPALSSQKYCCLSCSSSMRSKKMPKVPAAAFDALAPQAFYQDNTRLAARLVLVSGKSQTKVSRQLGMSTHSVHQAVKRFLARYNASK